MVNLGNLVVHISQMLHTMTQVSREDFIFYYVVRGGHLGHLNGTVWTNLSSPAKRILHTKFEFIQKCFKVLTDGRTDAGAIGIL